MTHVAYVITRGDAIGGATVHVRDMARHLEDNGMRASVLVGGDGEAASAFTRAGLSVHRLRHLQRAVHPLYDGAAILELAGLLRRLRPDLVSTHTAKAGCLGRVAARLAGVPAIYTPHGWTITDRISRSSGRIYRMAEKAAAPLARRIVNVCGAEEALALEYGVARKDRLVVIHNGVRDVGLSLRANPALQPAHIVMVARFEPPKDHALLLRALGRLRELPWTLELLGGGPKQSEMHALATELGVAARVCYTPSNASVPERLAAAQVFVLASRSEGFPRSILEAMRAGLPVVASDVGGVAEAVRDGETGYVAPRGDEGGLAERLRLLIADPARRARYGAAGRRNWELRFTFERMAAATVALYQEVLDRSLVPAAAVGGGYR